ncbi:MAG TPA: NTP transferase domain-containing protein [Solirubrobacteraceae bacterium]|nr:NTP transferase domain-containing protein [Solirubrobacteraceae bacterium]
MRLPVRVVINCAGEGRRLGLGKTKALVSVLGEPLVSWHLRMLRDVDDVVVVVGYQANEVIDTVRAARSDVAFAFNHEYATTGTAASLARGASGAAGDVISLDGDLLVHPEDFRTFLADAAPCLGVGPRSSTDAWLTSIERMDGGLAATGFHRDGDGMEWTGLVRVPGTLLDNAVHTGQAHGHVYEMLTPHLPLPVRQVRTREIDTAADYDEAVAWLAPIAHHWT